MDDVFKIARFISPYFIMLFFLCVCVYPCLQVCAHVYKCICACVLVLCACEGQKTIFGCKFFSSTLLEIDRVLDSLLAGP